jgi:exopolysaccharide biosynthesis polyprenyl glycosylphosphotransferase
MQTIADEQEFLRILYIERKRTERTRRPFLLMLVDAKSEWNGSLEGVIYALQSSKRETDVCGWYEGGNTLGVIFNEINNTDASTIAAIRERVTTNLRQTVGEAETDDLEITIRVFPEAEDNQGPVDLTLYPDLRKRPSKKIDTLLKRAIDVIGSVLLLLLTFPVMLGIAIAIRLNSKGPILFRQTRVGQYGKRFTFLKFRSMYVNCDPAIHRQYVTRFISGKSDKHTDDSGDKVYKITKDPRVTAVGRWLRKTSLDELPQLWNVLRGEMSLVGPRPPLPYEVERYEPWHMARVIEAKPGITGLWQVSGRSRLTFNEMVRLDLAYIREASVWLDLKILLKTPRAVFSGDGAY